jgi:hypothetical protein
MGCEMTTILAQTTTTGPTSPGQALELRGSGAVVFLVVVGLVLVAVWFIPVLLDARRAYRLRQDVIGFLRQDAMRAVEKDGLSLAELKVLVETIGEPATGQRGLARALLALSVTAIVGVIAFALLLSSAADAEDLRKTIVTSLLSVLGVVVGFYFGSRSVESAVETGAGAAGTPAAGPRPGPSAGPVLRVVEPTGPTTLSKRDDTWNPVEIRLEYLAGENVDFTVAGDEPDSLQQVAGDPSRFRYAPRSPAETVTIRFWLRGRPETTVLVQFRTT